MRSIILLVVGIFLLAACSGSQASVAPQPTPDVSKFSSGQAISVVQGSLGNCSDAARQRMMKSSGGWSETYLRGGKWKVVFKWSTRHGSNIWEVFESTLTARAVAIGYC